jgi:hypothetical protein
LLWTFGISDDCEKMQVGGHNPALEELTKYEENVVYQYIYIGNVYKGYYDIHNFF